MRQDIYTKESKQDICNHLTALLLKTDAGADVKSLEYMEDLEAVKVTFTSGYRRMVNVACDSGLALIKDVLQVF